ncbi:hypothetical protein S40288_09592 [Stachybotrys chartarum IBT 40288]|nr:hypothetical protein S40288_09592 [Stachybotrys chartarum IBT 40288]
MDPYDSQHHPSQSIPDAAYPDTPYRPGQGQQSSASSYSLHSSGSFTNSHGQSGFDFDGFRPNLPSHQSWQQSAPSQSITVHGSSTVPDVPPPPYAPSPTSPSSQRHDDSIQSIPLQPIHPLASPPPTHVHAHDNAYGTSYYPATSPMSPTRPYGFPGAMGSNSSTCSGKLGPVAQQRRRRRLKICLICLTVIVLAILGLILGVAMGVIKERQHGQEGPE